MLKINISVYNRFFDYMFKEKYKVIKTMSNSTRAILANLCRIRNMEIEKYIYNNFKKRFNENKQKYFHSATRFLLGASIFSFAEDKITDEEIQECLREFPGNESNDSSDSKEIDTIFVSDKINSKLFFDNMIFRLNIYPSANTPRQEFHNVLKLNDSNKRLSAEDPNNFIDSTWTQLIDSKSVKLWRRPLKSNVKLFEYRLCGSFDDISAEDFFFVQTDIEYRKKWDDLVVDLRVLGTDEDTDTEIIRWVTHYPYPMKDREYIFKRRFVHHKSQESAIIVSKAINSSSSKIQGLSAKNVKVGDYKSVMYIKSHSTFKEHGLDYFLAYYDDPQTSFPSAAVSWMSTAGIPSFMIKVHKAALQLKQVRAQTDITSPPLKASLITVDTDDSKETATTVHQSFYSYFSSSLRSFDFSLNKPKNDRSDDYDVEKSQ